MTVAANPLSELNEVAFQIARATAAITALKTERNALVLQLLDEGYSEREVARAARMTGPRVNQIKAEAVRLAKYHDAMARTQEAMR